MGRVIKADQVRFVEREPSWENNQCLVREQLEGDSAPGLDANEGRLVREAEDQAGSLRRAMEQSKREQEMQLAYDELITAAQEEVALILEDARREAAALLQAAEEQGETLRAEAMEVGLAEGHALARQEAQELLDTAQAQSRAALEQTEQERLLYLEQNRQDILRLSLDMAERILKYELDSNHEAYLSILDHAMNQIKVEGRVTVHVNAAEFVSHFDSREKAKLTTENGTVSVDVVVDPAVEPGACLIETESGILEAGADVQLEQMALAMGLEARET